MTGSTVTSMSSRRSISLALAIVVTALMSVACQWRDLDYDYIDTAKVSLYFDWSESSLNGESGTSKTETSGLVKPGDIINGRTAVFFPMDGGAPVIKMSHRDTMTVNLLVGQYMAAFFNETYDDFDNIAFSGISSFEELQAVLKEDVASSARALYSIAREPDLLAVETMVPFEVTEDMVRYTRAMEEPQGPKSLAGTFSLKAIKMVEESMNVTVRPHDVVYPVVVEVAVSGMDNIVSAGTYISGFAGGFDFSESKPVDWSVTHKVSFSDKSFFPGSDKDGIMEGDFMTFGYRGGRNTGLENYDLEFRAALVNGEVFTETRSINDLITEVTEDGRKIIKITIGGDNPIVVPDVEPVGGDDGMWHVDVGDWDEIEIPVGWQDD